MKLVVHPNYEKAEKWFVVVADKTIRKPELTTDGEELWKRKTKRCKYIFHVYGLSQLSPLQLASIFLFYFAHHLFYNCLFTLLFSPFFMLCHPKWICLFIQVAFTDYLYIERVYLYTTRILAIHLLRPIFIIISAMRRTE